MCGLHKPLSGLRVDCLYPPCSEVSWVVGYASSTYDSRPLQLPTQRLRPPSCRHLFPTPLLRQGVGRVAGVCGHKLFALNSPRFIPTPLLRRRVGRVPSAGRSATSAYFSEPRGQAFPSTSYGRREPPISTFLPPGSSRRRFPIHPSCTIYTVSHNPQ